ncbi:MAG: MurT ligase domain-containing protein [Sphaerobacter sp.]|nr:MurT ligase domain-containing protein [Sphaerobacter sp.]
MDPRLALAVMAGKASATLIRRLGRGGGTAAPGVVASRVDPAILDKLARQVAAGCVVVAGTNGKTTTARMLAGICACAGLRVIHNRTGSNLVRGITAAFAAQSSLTGRPRGDVAVIEADEAAFPEVVRRTRPRLILLLNLFRDQLDRYGELDTVAARWGETLRALPPTTIVLVNADDPALATLTEGLTAPRRTFGLRDGRHQLDQLPHAADAATCRRCGAPLTYARLFLSHLGDYVCTGCGYRRPPLDTAAREVALCGLEELTLTLETADGPLALRVGVPGLYNAYNALAAAAAALALGLPPVAVAEGLAAFRSAFGRIERVTYRGRRLVIVLIKNPVGFNEVLRMLEMGGAAPTLILINDLDADGRDVSWLWDVDAERLRDAPVPLYTGGIRGDEMALRLKYAGVPPERLVPLGDLPDALDSFVDDLPPDGTGFVLPTYTAMLRLREVLAARGVVHSFWQD